jgi:hypothetical protein
MPPQQYTMMQDLALPFAAPLGAAELLSCRKAGNERPHTPAVAARSLRRDSRRIIRSICVGIEGKCMILVILGKHALL